MDEYIVIKCMNGNGRYFYYKNGKLHREAGPAILVPKAREENHLSDEKLYEEKLIKELSPSGYKALFFKLGGQNGKVVTTVGAYHYIEGKAYREEDFEIEVKRFRSQKMQKELSGELTTTQTNNKKPKI